MRGITVWKPIWKLFYSVSWRNSRINILTLFRKNENQFIPKFYRYPVQKLQSNRTWCFSTLPMWTESLCMLSDSSHLQSDGAKEAYGALLTLLVECARCKLEPATLALTLSTSLQLPPLRRDKIVLIYEKNRASLEAALAHVTTCPPHIVDTSWVMDYCLQASHLCSTGQLLYHIQLHTESPGTEKQSKHRKKIHFICNLPQLHNLVSSIKETCKLIDRTANNWYNKVNNLDI